MRWSRVATWAMVILIPIVAYITPVDGNQPINSEQHQRYNDWTTEVTPMSRKYIITRIKIEGKSKRKRERTTADLMSRVFSDSCKESLSYYLAEELQKKNLVILDLRLRDVTPWVEKIISCMHSRWVLYSTHWLLLSSQPQIVMKTKLYYLAFLRVIITITSLVLLTILGSVAVNDMLMGADVWILNNTDLFDIPPDEK